MKLKETTVYVPTLKRDAPYEICSWDMRDDGDDWTVPETNATKEIGYFHTKEQLTELLSSVFYSGQQYERNINQAREADRNGWNFVPVNAKYINELLIELFNTEE